LKQFKEEIMQLLLVRHAQSANNALPTELRVHDPGLTETGNLQAEHLADWLQTLPLTA
jgi:2,3-bisphosphoglycerate-dependent phosphoglycerate mutase